MVAEEKSKEGMFFRRGHQLACGLHFHTPTFLSGKPCQHPILSTPSGLPGGERSVMETDTQKVVETYARHLQPLQVTGQENLTVPHLKQRISRYLRKTV